MKQLLVEQRRRIDQQQEWFLWLLPARIWRSVFSTSRNKQHDRSIAEFIEADNVKLANVTTASKLFEALCKLRIHQRAPFKISLQSLVDPGDLFVSAIHSHSEE